MATSPWAQPEAVALDPCLPDRTAVEGDTTGLERVALHVGQVLLRLVPPAVRGGQGVGWLVGWA